MRLTREGLEGAERARCVLAEAEVDHDDVTETLEKEGLWKFTGSFDETMGVIRERPRVCA